jgi:hypothetical protein
MVFNLVLRVVEGVGRETVTGVEVARTVDDRKTDDRAVDGVALPFDVR